MPSGQTQENDPGVLVQLAAGWHPSFWPWHSSKSIIYPKWDSVSETAPNGAKKKLKESPLIGAKEPIFPIEG